MRQIIFYSIYVFSVLASPIFFASATNEAPLTITISIPLIYVVLLFGWPLALYFFLVQKANTELFGIKGVSFALLCILAMTIVLPVIEAGEIWDAPMALYVETAITLLCFFIFFETARLVSYFEKNNPKNIKAILVNFGLLLFLPLGFPFLQAKVQHLRSDS